MVQLPPLDGTLYLPDILDFHLKHNPKQSAYIFAQDEAHIVKITFEQLARAVHRAAYELRPKRGRTNGTVVALIANADVLLYHTIVLACVRAGFVPFMISPRNSVEAINAMLRKISCSRVLCIKAHSAESNIIKSLSAPDLVVSEIPTLETLYGPDLHGLADSFEPYPSPAEAIGPYEDAFIIHSSGSTNFPKPVPQKFLTILHWMGFLKVSGMEDSRVGLCAAMGLPSFHAFGVNFQLLYPLALGKPTAIFPPTSFNFVTGQVIKDAIPVVSQPATILRHVQLTRSDVLLTVPSLLTAWRSNPREVEVLKSLRAVCCSSGPLPEGVGDDLVSQGVPLCTSYGATEFGIPTYRLPLNNDARPTLDFDKNDPARLHEWKYVAFNDLTTLRLIPTSDHDKYELQIITCDTHLPAIENLTDIKGYATCDVVQAHPTKKGLWRVIGRSDDVIVLSTGEKVVPNPLQDIIGSSPIISAVIMFGRGKPHCGLIIEPRDPDLWEGRTNELVDEIWPLIEKANSSAPSFSRILRDMVIVTAIDKPMARVGKGSLARQSTLNLYESEMEHAYQRFDLGCSMQPIETSEAAEMLQWLTPRAAGLIAQNLEIDADRDLFELGFDSISAVSLRAQILGAMPKGMSSMIGQTFIYDHPTLSAMAERLASLMSGDDEVTVTSRKEKEIERMVSKYTTFLPLNPGQTFSPSNVILLTGSTGSLGSHILEALLRDSRVCKIFLLNRTSGSSAPDRQKLSFRSKGLDASMLHSRKITWLEGDIADVSERIQDVNIIIHNAWRLDFNLSLSSYEPLIRSTHALIDVARAAKHRVHFIFTSSVSVAQNWDKKLGPVTEELLETRHALGKGYGESKYVVERILQRSGVDFTSLRIGQVAGGAPLGAWATSDWVPAMVRTSVEIGALPSAVGTVSWIPMPVVSQSTVDVALSPHPRHVLNLTHPYPTPWNAIMDGLSASMTEYGVTPKELQTIPFSQWVERVAKLSNGDANNLSRAPAIKLLPYFGQFSASDSQLLSATGAGPEAEAGGRPRFVTDKAREASKAFEALNGPLDKDDVKLWVSFWSRSGFLPCK